jgi:hypothetical protein
MEDNAHAFGAGSPYGHEVAPTSHGEPVSDDARREEMSATFDDATRAKEAETRALPQLPQYHGEDKSIEATMERTWDWIHSSPEERQLEAEAQQSAEQIKADAAKYGLTTQEALALKNEARQPPAEWQALTDRISASAPNVKPHETISRLVDIAEHMDRDPVTCAQAVLGQYGYRITGIERVR